MLTCTCDFNACQHAVLFEHACWLQSTWTLFPDARTQKWRGVEKRATFMKNTTRRRPAQDTKTVGLDTITLYRDSLKRPRSYLNTITAAVLDL